MFSVSLFCIFKTSELWNLISIAANSKGTYGVIIARSYDFEKMAKLYVNKVLGEQICLICTFTCKTHAADTFGAIIAWSGALERNDIICCRESLSSTNLDNNFLRNYIIKNFLANTDAPIIKKIRWIFKNKATPNQQGFCCLKVARK